MIISLSIKRIQITARHAKELKIKRNGWKMRKNNWPINLAL